MKSPIVITILATALGALGSYDALPINCRDTTNYCFNGNGRHEVCSYCNQAKEEPLKLGRRGGQRDCGVAGSQCNDVDHQQCDARCCSKIGSPTFYGVRCPYPY
ncbi:Avr5 [Fulvia fulva]|uniref:Avr5 n=1 Tax=Passalora fulva TaxID=5499 RepID=A0A023UJQ9_PASFU|nr:Avr5 [Fulvia fulva]KAK4634872.1 Avr5 [Fulvia fulva]KAK4638462.1 Avr5 [Fulvia fulva]WPV24939.1 Avr5 [Fulvia fulva]